MPLALEALELDRKEQPTIRPPLYDPAFPHLLAIPDGERANEATPVPENLVSRVGDLWICGKHRVLCGVATQPEDVARLLGDRQPILMVTDPPYGIELDSEWRDRRPERLRAGGAQLHEASHQRPYPGTTSVVPLGSLLR